VINNRVCRVCLALRAARFARVALIAASAGPDALAPAARLYASCLWCAPGFSCRFPDLASSLIGSSCPPPTPPPPPTPARLRRLSAFALAASRSTLSAFALLGLTGDSGVLCATPPPPPLRRERTRAVGTASAAFPRRVHPTMGGRLPPLVPRPCGRGRGCRQFLRAFFLRQFSVFLRPYSFFLRRVLLF
jgi:hypothetical protein